MEYINKPTKPNRLDFESGEAAVIAMQDWANRATIYNKQCLDLERELHIVENVFQETKDPKLAERKAEINRIQDQAEKGLLVEKPVPKQSKIAGINFSVELEIRDEFEKVCKLNNMTIAEALRNAMIVAINTKKL